MPGYAGQQIGNYTILRLLGRGGFADVYQAEHIYLKSQVAIKMLFARLNPESLEHFLSEARHLSSLIHPRIVRVLDFGIENEIPFLVMDYAPNGTLRQHHLGVPLPLSLVVSYVNQVASALQYAHDEHLIHRDLKPENLLLDAHSEVLLSDFGIAMAMNTTEYMNISALSGTLAYMAPEQLRGKPVPASDQYSLAIITYEWLSGKRPFQGALTELCSQHLLEPPPPLSGTLDDLPPAIETVLFTALAKDPRERFENIQAFAEAFEQASLGSPIHIPASTHFLHTEPIPSELEPSPPIHFYNLPIKPNQLVGRQEERQAASVLLVRPEVRLLSMIGVGGIGKTRLALSVVSGLYHAFPSGVCFVPLAPLKDAALVISTIARTLGLGEQGQTTVKARLISFLQKKQILLLLDNFEHLTSAAPDLVELLSSCPQIKLLVTTRAVLQVTGEQVFNVPPLSLPTTQILMDLEYLARSDAITLFVQRAKEVRSDFQLQESNATIIAEICNRLDGLPLAIELAAARLLLLSPRALLKRLERRLPMLTSNKRGVPARQQTLRHTIIWSYDLLSPEEQKLFRRLSLFVEGYTLEAVEWLYEFLGEDPTPIIDRISSLLDKSLIFRREKDGEDARLGMLETIREFGRESLIEAGELEQCQEAHITYYLNFLKQNNPSLDLYAVQPERYVADYANIRVAVQTAIEHGMIKEILTVAETLTCFWAMRGMFSEGHHILEQLLQASAELSLEEETHAMLPHLSFSLGFLLYWQNDGLLAIKILGQTLQSARLLQDRHSEARAMTILAMLESARPGGDMPTGIHMLQESIKLLRQNKDIYGLMTALTAQFTQAFHLGQMDQARLIAEENVHVAIGMEASAPFSLSVAASLHYLGWISYHEKAYTLALEKYDQALPLFRPLGTPPFFDEALLICALTHLALGQDRIAASLIEEIRNMGLHLGHTVYLIRGFYGLGCLALYEKDFSRASVAFVEAIQIMAGMWLPQRLQWILFSSLEKLALIAWQLEQPGWATRLFGIVEQQRSLLSNISHLDSDQAACEQTIKSLRNVLGKDLFAIFWHEGQNATIAQVLQEKDAPPIMSLSTSSEKPRDLKNLSPAASASGLTSREVEIVRLLVQGLSNAQIAAKLTLSVTTVNSYLRSIYSKLDVSSRTQAMRYVIDHQII